MSRFKRHVRVGVPAQPVNFLSRLALRAGPPISACAHRSRNRRIVGVGGLGFPLPPGDGRSQDIFVPLAPSSAPMGTSSGIGSCSASSTALQLPVVVFQLLEVEIVFRNSNAMESAECPMNEQHVGRLLDIAGMLKTKARRKQFFHR